jgi:probable HAF family extracellular repeat protein
MTVEFTTLNDNNDPTFNQLLGINNKGEISGYFGSGSPGHPNKGYTLEAPYGQGSYTNENFPGSTQTQVTGLNDGKETVGFWVDQNGNQFGFVEEGNKFIEVVDPLAKGTAAGGATTEQLLGVNDKGIAVGFYTDADGNNHGFAYDIAKHSFQPVTAGSLSSVTATGINNKGDISGFFQSGNNTEGFVEDPHGRITLLAGPSGAVSVQALGLNDEGQVVGSFTDGNGNTHGFLYNMKSANYTTIDDPHQSTTSGMSMTVANGINDKGQIVGFYLDAAGNTDGMLVQVSSHGHH